jgi:hypothetical protein
LIVSHRPLVLVTGLTLGDFLLWSWSLNGNHDVIALISGLTLPPLALAAAWLIALTAGRLLAAVARRRGSLRARTGTSAGSKAATATSTSTSATAAQDASASTTAASSSSSRKIAA